MSRESRMTAGILLPTTLFLSVLSPDVLPLKAREEACRVTRQESGRLHGFSCRWRRRDRKRTELLRRHTLDVGVLREKGIDRWLAT